MVFSRFIWSILAFVAAIVGTSILLGIYLQRPDFPVTRSLFIIALVLETAVLIWYLTRIRRDLLKLINALSNDDPTLALNFLAKVGADFPVLLDPFSQTANVYGLTGVPETYIVDKKGILRQKYLGPRHWSSDEAKKMIMSYINR
jgi:hypothetical protein